MTLTLRRSLPASAPSHTATHANVRSCLSLDAKGAGLVALRPVGQFCAEGGTAGSGAEAALPGLTAQAPAAQGRLGEPNPALSLLSLRLGPPQSRRLPGAVKLRQPPICLLCAQYFRWWTVSIPMTWAPLQDGVDGHQSPQGARIPGTSRGRWLPQQCALLAAARRTS